MISAYPLITSLLFSSPPSSLLSLIPRNPSCSHLVRERVAFSSRRPPSFVASPSVCPSSPASIPRSSPEKGFCCMAPTSFASLLHPLHPTLLLCFCHWKCQNFNLNQRKEKDITGWNLNQWTEAPAEVGEWLIISTMWSITRQNTVFM